jgi:hypothetical protein
MGEALEEAARTFAKITRAKLDVFKSMITGRDNSDVVGSYIEEVVRGFINSWIAPMRICHGSLWYPSGKNPRIRQIDGLVWQPSFGPAVVQEGSFLLLHPNTVSAVVEIKRSEKDLHGLYNRLNEIADEFLIPTGHDKRDAVGLVISHPSPESVANSNWSMAEGHVVELHSLAIHHCPIFILFDSAKDELEPYYPGIKNLIVFFNMIANTPRLNALI